MKFTDQHRTSSVRILLDQGKCTIPKHLWLYEEIWRWERSHFAGFENCNVVEYWMVASSAASVSQSLGFEQSDSLTILAK